MNPTFSVIIPTFNRANLIQRAVNSVFNQTFKDFEIIIVDDASTDSTHQIIKQFEDKRIEYINLPENKGPSTARNKGIQMARGKYISLLDSDDEFLPDFLEESLKAIESSTEDVGFSWSGTISISNTNTDELKREHIYKRLWSPKYQNRDEAYKNCLSWDPVWGTGHGVTVKSSVFKKIGLFDENLRAREDIDLLVRLIKEYEFKVIPKYLVKIHKDSNIRVDKNYLNQARAYIKIYNKHSSTIKKNDTSFIFFNKMIANNFYRAGYYIKSIQYLLKILNKKPTDKKIYKRIAVSILRSFGKAI